MVSQGTNTEYRADGVLLSYTRSMVDGTNEWRMMGDYAIWSGHRSNQTSPHVLYELIGKKVLRVPASSSRAILHPIKAGVWFEVRHLFGFWMMSDVDTIWLDAPGADAHYYTLCVGGAESRPGQISFGWVCPDCGELFNTKSFAADGGRFESCLEASETLVTEFNASQTLRTCPACASVHPESYGFYPDRDSASARQMRAQCD